MKLVLSAAAAALLSSVVSGFAPRSSTVTTTATPLRPSTTWLKAGEVLDSVTGRSQLDPAVIAKYNALPYPDDTVLAEYVWVDADGNTRSKTRTLPKAKVRTLLYCTVIIYAVCCMIVCFYSLHCICAAVAPVYVYLCVYA